MSFFRCVKVLRGASNSLRHNLQRTEANLETVIQQTNYRVYSASAKNQSESLKDSKYVSLVGDSTVIQKDVGAAKLPVIEFVERPARANVESEVDEIITEEELDVKLPEPFDPCHEDVSYLVPNAKPTLNLAAYANNSEVIQELAKLGVEIYKIEKKPKAVKVLLSRTFDDMKPYIRFLHDCGIPADQIGHFITKNPYIFEEDLANLHTRIRYLRAHNYSIEMIQRIVTKNPFWLLFSTVRIDQRLGFFQNMFNLKGSEVRTVSTRQPKLITYSLKHIKETTFAFKEEMGFNSFEMKAILLDKPKLFINSREKIVAAFDYAHNVMKIPHELLKKQPRIIGSRIQRLKQRHEFLVSLGRNQYDPLKPLYVSPDAIVSGTDSEFCEKVAKASIETYNLFLKSI